jgi:hypothetical protein
MKNIFKHLGDLFRYKQPLKPIAICMTAEGFQLRQGSEATADVNWADVRKIVSYKHDNFSHDEIIVAFNLASGEVVEISEEWPDFSSVVEEMKRRFPNIPGDWYSNIMLPPFAANETVLYETD